MQDVGIGDVFFIILILGVIHGIMYLVSLARRRKAKSGENQPGQ